MRLKALGILVVVSLLLLHACDSPPSQESEELPASATPLSMSVSALLPAEAQDPHWVAARADVVVEGYVVDVTSPFETQDDTWGTMVSRDNTIEVASSLKGDFSKGDLVIVRTDGGTIGDSSVWVEDETFFREGEHVIVMVVETSPGIYTTVCGGCGKYTLEGEVASSDCTTTVFTLSDLEAAVAGD